MEDQQQEKYTLRFTGSSSEFFKIWIVNILLSIVTLGIYSAWAKVRTNRYFYGNTLLNDAPFDYHAKPKQILIGRIIALVLLIIYVVAGETSPAAGGAVLALLLLITPWIIYRSIRFNARMTSHRNVRFNFNGSTLPFYQYLFLYPIVPAIVLGVIASIMYYLAAPQQIVAGITVLAVLSLYLTFPWVQRNVTEYVMNHYTYGQGQFATSPPLSTKKYYLRYLVAVLLFLSVFVIVAGVAYALNLFGILAALPSGELGELSGDEQTRFLSAFLVSYGVVFFVGFIVRAYIQAGIRGHVFAHTKLDDKVALESTVTTAALFSLLLTNFLLMVLTLGLAYPWVKVRLARYFAENTHVHAQGDLSHYISEQQEKQLALGEEMGDVFDVDMDLGL